VLSIANSALLFHGEFYYYCFIDNAYSTKDIASAEDWCFSCNRSLKTQTETFASEGFVRELCSLSIRCLISFPCEQRFLVPYVSSSRSMHDSSLVKVTWFILSPVRCGVIQGSVSEGRSPLADESLRRRGRGTRGDGTTLQAPDSSQSRGHALRPVLRTEPIWEFTWFHYRIRNLNLTSKVCQNA
jgi:hypothetical protein